ncbi:serine/threonine-protein kinase [Duganella sp. 1411]|uniref:serine/threonine-protein kinase n=1 Tax=Duganella sp. 1411 TaxID=2806572 RepID=UPI001AE400F3|nr:serine/threonine-protein kinase [Duganella sp. 1411]MBP1202766.1 serine/threonine-protein kinase [Duganella sp. 1411]
MPAQLGKYRIDAILGKGAMGVVYKAFDPHIERVVALKTVRKELFSDARQAELISRFKNEAQAAGRLQHPNIVSVYEYGEDADSAYIAMEFVDGTPLNALMVAGQPTAPARVAAWMGDLLLALDYAHARGVVHRDIKPANLLVTAAAQLKVGDFGVARIESSTLTQTGSMIGTPSYMSPEQFRGETVDGRSDVFSAGVLLYQLLTGVRPFTGSPTIVMQQILNQVPPPPSQLLPSLGTGYDRLVELAMAKAPADRFASARAFLDALVRVGQSGGADADALADTDRTVLAAALRAQPPRGQPDIETGTGSGVHTMTPWKLEAFPELETILSRQIGPMARFLLKKVAAKADGIDELCEALLAHIPSELGKVEFQQGVALVKRKLAASGTGTGTASRAAMGGRRATGMGTGLGGATGVAAGAAGRPAIRAPVAFDDALVEATAQTLTMLIGPIARVVVKRAARQTNDRDDFLRLVAAHIEMPSERARFLAENGVAG